MNKREELREFLKNRKPECDFILKHLREQYKHLGRPLQVLEVGSNCGAMVSWLATDRDTTPLLFQTTGIDSNPGIIQYAKVLCNGIENTRFFQNDILQPTLFPESFDVIICLSNTLGELSKTNPRDNALLALAQMHILLRKDGLILLEVSNEKYMDQHEHLYHRREKNTFFAADSNASHWFSKRELLAMLGHAHFDPLGPSVPCPSPADSEELRKLDANWLIAARKA